MNIKLERALTQLVPFIGIGIAITLIIGLFIVLSYVVIWGVLLGGVIWLGFTIKNYLFTQTKEDEPRIIEHDPKK